MPKKRDDDTELLDVPDDEAIEEFTIPEEDPKKDRQLRKESKLAARTPAQSRAALRRKTRMFYDLQRLRIQTGGRTLDRATDIELHEIDITILEARTTELRRAEKNALSDIKAHLHTMPVYRQVLSDKEKYKGIGPTLAAVIISEVDIERAKTVSALWRYAGLATVPGWRCKTCRDLVETDEDMRIFHHTYNRKDKCPAGNVLARDHVFESRKAERPVEGEKLHYNRHFKTKMVGVMASCLIKANSPWRRFYDDYKNRLASAKEGRNDGHRHQMALRYMTKMVLQQIWEDWRRLEGLPVRPSYAAEYLGLQHHA